MNSEADFRDWYQTHGFMARMTPDSSPPVRPSVAAAPKSSGQRQKNSSSRSSRSDTLLLHNRDSQQQTAQQGLRRARQLLRLHCFSIDDLLETLSEAASVDGGLQRADFARAMGHLCCLAGLDAKNPQRQAG